MNIKRLDQHTHFGSGLKSVIILYHKLIAVAQHHHFIMYSFKNTGLYGTTKLCHIRHREYIQILRTNHHIHRCVFAESFVHTFKVTVTEMYQLIFHHDSVQDITFSDKVGHERVNRLIVDVGRRTNLLNTPLTHHHDGITQCQGFFLIVRHVHKGNAQRLVHFLQLHLHVLTHLQVKRSQRLVQQQYFRLVHNGSGNGHTLLLSTRKRVDIAVLIIGHAHHFQGSLYFFKYRILWHLFQFQAKSDIIIHIQMRE